MMRYKSIEEQNAKFIEIIKQNSDLMNILNYIEELKLPNYYIAAGSVFQTIWNYYDNKPLNSGIKDSGHATCVKKLPVGGNRAYLLAITFDSDEIEHVEVVVKGKGAVTGLQLKEIPFRYEISEYKK